MDISVFSCLFGDKELPDGGAFAILKEKSGSLPGV
jgi:hypothetical protein